jgi:hypothetical protein
MQIDPIVKAKLISEICYNPSTSLKERELTKLVLMDNNFSEDDIDYLFNECAKKIIICEDIKFSFDAVNGYPKSTFYLLCQKEEMEQVYYNVLPIREHIYKIPHMKDYNIGTHTVYTDVLHQFYILKIFSVVFLIDMDILRKFYKDYHKWCNDIGCKLPELLTIHSS